jgi:hypothetical protein
MKRLQLFVALLFVAISICAQTSESKRASDGLKWTDFTENSLHGAKVGHHVVVPAKYNSISYKTFRLTFGIFCAWADNRLDLYNTDGKLFYSKKGDNVGVMDCFEIYGRKYMCISIGNAREIIYGILVDEDGNVIINGEDYNVWSIGYIDCNGVYVFLGIDKSGKRILFDLDGDKFLDDFSGVGFFYNSGFFFTEITKDNVCHGAFYLDGEEQLSKNYRITWKDGFFYEVLPSGQKNGFARDSEVISLAYINGDTFSTDKGEMQYFMTNYFVGLKNSAGKVIVPAQYNDVVYCEEPDGFSYLAACKEDKVAVYNLDGKVIIPLSSGFNEVTMIGCPGRGCFLATKNVMNPIFALFDFDGKTLIPISYKYDELYYYSKSFIVGRNGKVGLWDMFGKVIIPVSRGYENFFLTGDDQALCVRNGEDYGLCDLNGVEKVATENKHIRYNKDNYTFEITKHNGTKEYKRAWFAPEDYSNQIASTTPSKSSSASKPASATKSSSTTKTFYRFTTTVNGVVLPSDNAPLEVTFNSDNSLTIEGRRWTYNNSIGWFKEQGWENGNDYVTLSKTKTQLVYTHQESNGLFMIPTQIITFSDTVTSQEDKMINAGMQNAANNAVSGSSGSSSSSSSSSNNRTSTSRAACNRCGGCGYIIEYTTNYGGSTKMKYCKECGKTVPITHYHQTCPSCKGTGLR